MNKSKSYSHERKKYSDGGAANIACCRPLLLLQLPPNHRILPTAASFGWTHIAAAADPQRSAEILEIV
jgi:hypothetical protein